MMFVIVLHSLFGVKTDVTVRRAAGYFATHRHTDDTLLPKTLGPFPQLSICFKMQLLCLPVI